MTTAHDHDDTHADHLGAPVATTIHGEALTRPKAPRELTTEQYALPDATVAGNGQPVRILGANPHRCRALVFCPTGATVVIGGAQLALGSGFTLPPANAGPVELRTTEAVYALAGAGGGVVDVLAEHYDG